MFATHHLSSTYNKHLHAYEATVSADRLLGRHVVIQVWMTAGMTVDHYAVTTVYRDL